MYVSYNLYSKITPINQNNPAYNGKFSASCAFICAAMVLNKDPNDMVAAGLNHANADWTAIASQYGKTAQVTDSTSLATVLGHLKNGYPVIAKSSSNPHWVVIYGYEGLDTVVQANNFRCVDAADGKAMTLEQSWAYTGVTRFVIFK